MQFRKELAVVGALMYSFSTFTISNLIYYHFLEPIICFPIFLIAIEYFLEKGRYRYSALIGASFLVSFINFYFIPCTFISGLIYVLCRLTSIKKGERLQPVLRAIPCIGVGLMLSMFILLPTVLFLRGGQRDDIQNFNLGAETFRSAYRLLTLVFPKFAEGPDKMLGYSGWNSNAAFVPLVGCFFAVYYVIKHRDWISLLVLVGVMFYLTPLNGVFSLFTDVAYSRWAYALVMFLILATLKLVDNAQYMSRDLIPLFASLSSS